jgi:hypothetical protein
MISPLVFLFALLACTASALAEDWRPAGDADPLETGDEPSYARRTAERPADGRQVDAHLALFTSPAYRLKVVDLGDGPQPSYPTLQEAFRAEGCAAGVNGGFFHADWRPVGLVISEGLRINRFETARLLSGVLYSDGKGTHLLRRGRFREQPGITTLLQTGPYLVDGARAVRGLSTENARRRSFVATDWRGHWALGATTDRLTLAELASILTATGTFTPWPVERAINLDGGSSTGFYFDRGADGAPVLLRPLKRVRNLLCITER